MASKVKPINNYTGYIYTVFTNAGIITRGDTLPFHFQFTENDGVTPIDVSGYLIYISFAKTLEGLNSVDAELEVVIPVQDINNGILGGEITDDQTSLLSAGSTYTSVKYIKPDGRTYIIDMAKIMVAENVTSRKEQ